MATEIESPKEWVKTDGIEGEHGIGQPTNPNQEPIENNPQTFKGDVSVKGDLYVKGQKITPATDELPPTTDANPGNVLKLDANKKPTWDTDESVPGTSSATAGQVLKLDAQKPPVWADDNAGMTNPMTATDDLIVGGTSGVPTRLPKGSNGDILRVN